MMKRIYTRNFEQYPWEVQLHETGATPLSIENFMNNIAYYKSSNVRKEMVENVRTLFYELAIEDNLRMGFLKGITIAIATLDMTEETKQIYEMKKDELIVKLMKVWMLPSLLFFEFCNEFPQYYKRPCAQDILDMRLVRPFLMHCTPAIENLYYAFSNSLELERIA